MHMTVVELAEQLNVTERYARKLIEEGRLPARLGPDGEPVIEWVAAQWYIAETNNLRRKATDELMLVSAEQHAIEQLHVHFNEFMHVARRATSAEVVRVRCAYEAMYGVMRFVANMDGTDSAARGQPDAFARAVVALAARVLGLSPEEVRQAHVLTDWGLTGVPAEPPITADVAVQLAERVLAASLGSQGR
ncbi:hypothetical protein [Burkholderia sp. BCC1993]|uniref:hypothetical protein n=1 Tax=Burkholderia sp. BCC1993 TaxID=2817444 RepID=UPI002AB31B3E|nr:hypothetical protein [Burkholderia sp. BCC1993]